MWVFQLTNDPVIKRTMVFEFQCTDGVCDSLDSILDRMSKVIHWINAPGVAGSVVGHMSNTVDDRITHVHVRRCHIDLGTKNFFSIGIFAFFHFFKKLEIFFNRTVTVRALFSRICQSSTVLADLIGSQVTDISFSFFDQFDGCFIHLSKVIRSKEKSVLPVSTKPFDISFNRFYKFTFFFCRVCIIKTHIKLAVVFLGKSVIQKNGFGMSDMEVSIRLRWEAGVYGIINTLCKVFINDVFNKIFRNGFVFHLFPS